ncbi:Spt3 [Carabus blaptoides fortunei]
MDNTTSISYCDKISLMMFGFGDSQKPNPETVQLVESVVLKQLREIVHEAAKNANRRSVKTIHPEDIIFLLRHDRHKMQRFVKYLDYKYVDVANINSNNCDSEVVANKKRKTLRAFIESIDETGELLDTDEFDTLKHDRAVRAERISSALDEDKYKEYAKARQASFFSKQFAQPNKFRLWVDPQHELNLTQGTIEILELLAYGIVGHITDMALILQQNMKRVTGDPLHMLTGSFYNSVMFNVPHISQTNLFHRKDLGSAAQAQSGQSPISVSEVRE